MLGVQILAEAASDLAKHPLAHTCGAVSNFDLHPRSWRSSLPSASTLQAAPLLTNGSWRPFTRTRRHVAAHLEGAGLARLQVELDQRVELCQACSTPALSMSRHARRDADARAVHLKAKTSPHALTATRKRRNALDHSSRALSML